MIKKIHLPLAAGGYDIVVGSGHLSVLGETLKRMKFGRDALVITNPIVRKLHGKKLLRGLEKAGFTPEVFEVPDGEKSKSAEMAFSLISRIAAFDVFKKPFIIAFGGGVTGDLAGFVAAIYKRGIPYIQVPTTLLAQVDSSIGGKVAVDLSTGKNLVGAFYQPRVVWTDIDLLQTLDRRQLVNGLAEVVKYGVIADKTLFKFLRENSHRILSLEPSVIEHVIAVCSQIKADVVAADEFETKGLRTILNFGHTVGHAVEAADGYDHYYHGEAVALGMRVASDIAVRKRLLKERERGEIESLLTDLCLPEKIRALKLSDILTPMKHDKKFISGKNRFVLPVRIGQVKVVEGVDFDLIKAAIKKYL